MVHAKRVLLVSLVAFICFLIWPMTPCWPRETITEWPANLQWLAQLLVWLDPPFNQCPSLHVAHGTLCLVVFVRMLPRWLGIVCVAWYALVFVSVVLTHQHHVVDVISGGALAGLALALLKERPVTHAA